MTEILYMTETFYIIRLRALGKHPKMYITCISPWKQLTSGSPPLR